MNLSEIEQVCLKEVLTITEVMAALSVTRKRVRDLCMSGKLVARQSGTIWLISKTSVDKRKEMK